MAPRGEISGHVFNVDLSYTSTCVGLDILEVIFNWIKGTFACFFHEGGIPKSKRDTTTPPRVGR